MTGIVSVYALFASDEEARRIGRQMVEERMAACVNILGPCHSIYRWKGKVEEGSEVPAIFKTTSGQAPSLRTLTLSRGPRPTSIPLPVAPPVELSPSRPVTPEVSPT